MQTWRHSRRTRWVMRRRWCALLPIFLGVRPHVSALVLFNNHTSRLFSTSHASVEEHEFSKSDGTIRQDLEVSLTVWKLEEVIRSDS